ncbi:hypothetical protein BGX33_004788, partial [Mortierella sp. NVP41]
MKTTLIVSALLAATVVSAGRLHAPTPSNPQEIVHRSYIIEYDDHYTHSHFTSTLKRRSIDVDVRKEYEIFNGAAITLRSDEHNGEHLASLQGVKNVWPVTTYSLPRIRDPIEPFAEGGISAAAVSNHNATGVNILQETFNLTGVGIKGYDFVGDDFTGARRPRPGPDPMDHHGHGTHVAGIIGGNALSTTISPRPIIPWVGVAPGVTFGIYKVLGKAGVTTTEVLLSAMEMAFKDGMD